MSKDKITIEILGNGEKLSRDKKTQYWSIETDQPGRLRAMSTFSSSVAEALTIGKTYEVEGKKNENGYFTIEAVLGEATAEPSGSAATLRQPETDPMVSGLNACIEATGRIAAAVVTSVGSAGSDQVDKIIDSAFNKLLSLWQRAVKGDSTRPSPAPEAKPKAHAPEPKPSPNGNGNGATAPQGRLSPEKMKLLTDAAKPPAKLNRGQIEAELPASLTIADCTEEQLAEAIDKLRVPVEVN